MGQKVHPKGLRIGITKDWDSRWYARRGEYVDNLIEDNKLRTFIKQRLYNAGVPRIEIERTARDQVRVIIHTAKPGMVIGKGGAGVEQLRQQLQAMAGKQVKVDIIEIKLPEVDAQLVAENVAQQLERRIAFRRAIKGSIGRAMRLGAKGIRIMVSGRLGGAEIARRERDGEGTVPLHTLRADIDYGFAEANTTYGKIGVKVWVYAGESLTARPPRDDRRDRRGGGERGPRSGPRSGPRGGPRRREPHAAT